MSSRPNDPAPSDDELLLDIWRGAFDRDDIGPTDDFFSLGGDSLVGAQIGIGIEAEWGVQISFSLFSSHPTPEAMAGEIDRLRRVVPSDGADGPPGTTGRAPVWSAQQEYCKVIRNPLEVRRRTYAMVLAIDGPLDHVVLQATIGSIVERHESLRTRFERDPDETVFQLVEPPYVPDLPTIDLSGGDVDDDLLAGLIEEAAGGFDLGRLPLVRFTLARLAPARHRLIVVIHHIIFDDASIDLMVDDLAQAYAALRERARPEPPSRTARYADFAARHMAAWRPDGTLFANAASWWREEAARAGPLPDIQALRPFLRRGPARRSDMAAGTDATVFAEDVVVALDRLAREEATNAYAVRIAIAAVFLARATGFEHASIGTVATARRHTSLNRVFGLFTSVTPVLVPCQAHARFRDIVARVHDRRVATMQIADAPTSLLHERLRDDGVHIPIPLSVVRTFWRPAADAGDVTFQWVKAVNGGPPSRGIWLALRRRQDGELCEMTFDTRIFDTDAMAELFDRLTRFVEAVAAAPDARLGELLPDGALLPTPR